MTPPCRPRCAPARAPAPSTARAPSCTGCVLYLARDIQPQRRRAVQRPEAGSAMAPGLVIDDAGAMVAWINTPGQPPVLRRLVRQTETVSAAIQPLGLDYITWPLWDQ